MNPWTYFGTSGLHTAFFTLALLALGGCATLDLGQPTSVPLHDLSVPVAQRLHALGRPDVLVLGEQHDAPDHQEQHRAATSALAALGELGAVVLEMADAGRHTQGLPADATHAQVQQALAWRDSAWPWAQYGPAVMAAVAARIPVYGGNLPRQRNPQVMKEPVWDTRVAADVLAHQRQAVSEGHCNLLPATQVGPMTRIQLARDLQLAQTLQTALVPGKTVLLLTGSQHANRRWGVPLHLPSHLRVKTVRLATNGPQPDDATGFDAVWVTPPIPPRDHCAELRGRP
jgi:uncharacterized iron-regulated protein